jgi:hypothetical protein
MSIASEMGAPAANLRVEILRWLNVTQIALAGLSSRRLNSFVNRRAAPFRIMDSPDDRFAL